MDSVEQTVCETQFTLRDFVKEAERRLTIEVVVGDRGLDHRVLEPICNRPGLALTGFYDFFAWERLQLIGQAENAYLGSLDAATRLERLRALIRLGSYCFIFSCGMNVPDEFVQCARESGVVVLRTKLPTRVFFHQCAFTLEKLRAPKTRIYGTTVEVAGLGVMLEGKPGLGKSETALGLIKHGNALVADDLTCLRKDVASNALFASAAPGTRNFMEIRGIGIIHVPSVFGVTAVTAEKRLDLVITLEDLDVVGENFDRTGLERKTRSILGVDVSQITIPVSAGRDLVNLVETAAQQYKLIAAGRDAVKVLDAQLIAHAVDPAKF